MITNAAGGIITKGLGRPAYAGMIVNYFSLTLAISVIPPPVSGGGGSGGGGPYPGPAWNVLSPGQVQNFFRPYSPQYQQQMIPVLRRTHLINIRIKFRGAEIDKMYEASERQADRVVKILNIVNKTRRRFDVVVTNLRNLTASNSKFKGIVSSLSVSIKNLRREKN